MSREEMVGAFMEGRLSRRTLVRRLMGSGVSVAAAVAYADRLAPEAHAEVCTPGPPLSGTPNDHYPLVSLKIKGADHAAINAAHQVKVQVSTSEPIYTRVIVFVKDGPNGLKQIGAIRPKDGVTGISTVITDGDVIKVTGIALPLSAGDKLFASLRAIDVDQGQEFWVSTSETLI
jgi:hypothetical protein